SLVCNDGTQTMHCRSTFHPQAVPARQNVYSGLFHKISTRKGGVGAAGLVPRALSHARTAHGGIRGASATGAANFQRRRAAAFRFSAASQQRTRTNRARPRPADAARPVSLMSEACLFAKPRTRGLSRNLSSKTSTN